jgi:CDP-glycerol glycerophosphotransferase (TagB/SpsB family)
MYRRLVEQDRRVIYADELDITPFLALADVMISDVSSAAMEFAALDKPVIFYNNPNRESYQNYNPDDIEFKWRDIGIQVHNLREMQDAVKRCFDIPSEYGAKRTRYTDQLFANKYDGLAANRIIKQSMSLLQTISFSRKVA